MKQEPKFKYFAFISYSSHDTEWGKRLQRKLEGYRMPATLCSEHGWKRKPINPVFFAPTDIQPGGLTAELQERLRASRNLIVICSPHSAKSEWVGKEIAFFHSLGRAKNIHFFIVDGTPHSVNPDTECFNPIIETLGLPEILGANIHERIYRWPWMNRERAYVQLITKLLGVEFDSIWQRHRRLLVRKITSWTIGSLIILSTLLYIWVSGQTVDVTVQLYEANEENMELPPLTDAIVCMSIGEDTKTDTIHTLSDQGLFLHIPHRFIGEEVRMTIVCKNYMNTDTMMVLDKDINLCIHRDPSVFGDIHFTLWNLNTETAVPNTVVYIDGIKTASDAHGHVSLQIPLPRQKPKYHITADIPLADDTIYMPCGEDDVILVKSGQ